MAVVEVNVVVDVGELVVVVEVVTFSPRVPVRNNTREIRLLDLAMVAEEK